MRPFRKGEAVQRVLLRDLKLSARGANAAKFTNLILLLHAFVTYEKVHGSKPK